MILYSELTAWGGRWRWKLTPASRHASYHSRLQEKTDQLLSLEREAAELREAMEQQKTKNNVCGMNWAQLLLLRFFFL